MIRKLLSRKTGVVKQVNMLFRNADQPRLHYLVSTMCDTSRFCKNLNDFAASGVSMDKTSAWWAALGEGVERYCAVFSDITPHRMGSYFQLSQEGLQAMPPEDFCLFSKEQYQSKGFQYVKPDSHSLLRWVQGRRLSDHASVYIPSCVVYNGYKTAAEERTILPNIHPGVACGVDLNGALFSALCEIVERDAMMVWWLNSLSMPRIASSEHKKLSSIVMHDCPHLRAAGVEVSFLWLKTDLDIPVVFCLLVDRKGSVVSGGCAARLTPQEALHKAFCEAAQTWLLALDLKRGHRSNMVGAAPYGIMDMEGEPLGTHIIHNLKAYSDQTLLDSLKPILNPAEKVSLADLPSYPTVRKSEEKLELIMSRFLKKGFQPIAVDLTSSDIAEVGLWVVRVYVPGMVPNTPTAYPPLGLKRLHDMPKSLGLNQREVGASWNSAPLPYS